MYNVLILLSTNIHEDVISNIVNTENLYKQTLFYFCYFLLLEHNIIMLVLLYYIIVCM